MDKELELAQRNLEKEITKKFLDEHKLEIYCTKNKEEYEKLRRNALLNSKKFLGTRVISKFVPLKADKKFIGCVIKEI